MNYTAERIIDWKYRGEYILVRHGIEFQWADQAALDDPDSFWIERGPPTMTPLEDLLALEATAAEEAETPPDIAGTYPNRRRSVVFSLRLTPEEIARLRARADVEGIPARTLARKLILSALGTTTELEIRLERVEAQLATLLTPQV